MHTIVALQKIAVGRGVGKENSPLAIEFSMEESSLLNQRDFTGSTALNKYL
jgi:hypothetical protein